MVFWTLLISALFTMSLLYVLWGPKKIWGTLISYGLLAAGAVVLIYYQFHGLFTLDLMSFLIPYLFVIPLHFSVSSIIKHYVLHDDMRTSKYFIALYNRILIASIWIFVILLIGIAMAVIDGVITQFDSENIWSISVTGIIAALVLISVISLGYRAKFTFVVVVGSKHKKVYELDASRSRLLAKKYLAVDLVYPRGIYYDQGKMKYLYYIKEDISLEDSIFKPIQSDLFDTLKNDIESYEALEKSYNEYIEQKSSI